MFDHHMTRLATALVWSPMLLPMILGPLPAWASADPSELCLRAASEAAQRTGVPYEVLKAIALVETGRGGKPWPWTVNDGGEGAWFDSAAEAEAHVAILLQEGRTNVDLGCFQLNYRWHAESFASIADMLDPARNAEYAASYLSEQFAVTGDWTEAAAAYHSATPEFAEIYREKFDRALAGLSGEEGPPPADEPARLNRFPLLLAGTGGRNGSLVPATAGGIRLIGAP
jgi:hypothetical protein